MKRTFLVAAATVAVLGLAAACASDEEIQAANAEEQADESEDVTIVTAGVDTLGQFTATLEVTNNSSKRSNYDVTVAFESPDGKTLYGTGWAYITNVEPGQTASGEAISTDAAPAGDFKTRIQELDRTSDVG
jgi:ABC-type glycerol-3-phosphate transport system substrate-binding protein